MLAVGDWRLVSGSLERQPSPKPTSIPPTSSLLANHLDVGPADRGERRRSIRLSQEGGNLTTKFVLDHLDLAARVEDPEVELVGHWSVLLQERALVGPEAFVDVVPELHIHARFPVIHSARLQHTSDQRPLVDLQ